MPAPLTPARIGDISPALVAACGATVSAGFMLAKRNPEAAAFARDPRFARGARRPAAPAALPRAIATSQALPPSRVGATVVLDPTITVAVAGSGG